METTLEKKHVTLKSLQDGIGSYRASVEKLGIVLEELVRMLDFDGSGIDAYLLHYVADSRETLRSILQLLEDN